MIEVRPVRTRRERRRFLTFPWRIYRGPGRPDAFWVPPLLPERAKALDPARGAFFRRGEAELFMAWRDGRPVGTICAGEDKAANRDSGRQECMFGFFECLEDPDAARALLGRAVRWGRERHLSSLAGPFNLDREDGYGVLVEGRDRPPVLLCGHTPPYYQGLIEEYGFRPARADNLAFAIPLGSDSPERRKLARLADRIRSKGWVTIRTPDLSHLEREVDTVHALLNQALAHLPDHRPWPRQAVEALLTPFARIADPELVLFAEVEGKTVGWFPGVPNLNELFIRVNGLRYPWDYLSLLANLRRHPDCLAIKSVLILPEYWGSGVALLLFDEMDRRAAARGYRWADLSLTSEDNPYTPALAQRMGAAIYKRYRVYRLDL
ncbi:MAG: GNAT family N-acetyltransferase [Spirochaetales bacterium]|nr:GNAT family N-acetyltransferase [Spirochaetales bacterium]